MTLYNFVDGGPLDMIMGSIVISNAVVMFASGSVNTVGKASELCTPNCFTQPYRKKQVAKIHSQWLGTLASAVHLATESHCCGI